MKLKLLAIIILTLFVKDVFSQDRYVVFFTDKNNSPYAISNPLQFLSQRAIDRRNKAGINIDSSDLPVNQTYIQGLINAGANVLNVSKWFNAAIIQTSSATVLNAINQLPYVQSSNNVGRIKKNANSGVDKFALDLPGNTSILKSASSNKSSSFSYGYAADQVNMLGLAQLHNLGYTGEGMIIAVLDAGFLDANIMTCFDSLFANNRVLYTWDFVDHESNVYNDHYHGAAVLSCIAANVPDTLIGTAPNASFILLRSEDANSEYIIEEYNWSVAAEFADSAGADVINSSLGYTVFDDPAQDHFYADMNGDTNPISIAADNAAKKGMIVVNSAGNEGNSFWNYISAPADADSILAIGAVDFSGTYASFSGNGPSYDGRVKPDVAAMGQNTWLYTPYSNNQVTQGNGTSFSSPVMAGAVTCLWQAWSSKTNMDIIQAVKRSASQYSNPDTLLGYGIPNFTLANSLLNLGEIIIPANAVIHTFPNPWGLNSNLTVLYYAQSGEEAKLRIFDMTGRQVFQQEFNTVTGAFNEWKINPKISNGSYIIEVSEGAISHTLKLIRY